MEDDKKPLQFNVSGIPQNDEIEVEDDEPSSIPNTKTGMIQGKQLPPDLMNLFSGLMKELGGVSDKELMKLFYQQTGIQLPSEEEDETSDEIDTDMDQPQETKSFCFELGKISHLFQKESFQQILIKVDPDLYLSFIELYGSGPYTTEFFSNKNWPCYSSCPVPLSRIAEFTVVDYNNKYILLYGKPQDATEQGIFMAVAKDENDNFQLVIPEYGNTYDLVNPDGEWSDDEMFADNPNNCKLFSSKDQELFTNEGKFKFLDLEKIHAGLTLLLCPVNEPLVSPNDFGELVQMRSTVDTGEYSSGLRIGVLKSNDSATAALFKRDFDIPEDKTTFDFYLRFEKQIDGRVLNFLADYFNQVDIKSTLLFKNTELKNFGRGDRLYIDFNLGNIADNILLWIQDKGNSTF